MRERKGSILLRRNVKLKERREYLGSRNSTEFNMTGRLVFHGTVASVGRDKDTGQSTEKEFLVILKVM